MTTIDDAQAATYRLANPDVEFNPAAAIARKWLGLKAQGVFIGVPIGNEMQMDDGTTCQAFTSGAVLHWLGGDIVEVL
jgi:hypothetical protein